MTATTEGWKVLDHQYTCFILLVENGYIPASAYLIAWKQDYFHVIESHWSFNTKNQWLNPLILENPGKSSTRGNFTGVGQECAVARSRWLSHVTLQNLCVPSTPRVFTPLVPEWSWVYSITVPVWKSVSTQASFQIVWPHTHLFNMCICLWTSSPTPRSIQRRSPWWQY